MSLSSQQSAYRQIFKATSLFGGVQLFGVIIGIVRVKFVAILLGATGVGIMGLLNAPINLIVSLTGLGIAISAVRNISEAQGTGDCTKFASVVKMLRRWAWITGLFGAVVTAICAPLLSRFSFGNTEYSWAFVWLSVTLLFQSLSKSQSALLQGTRNLKEMAKANVVGAFVGLLISLPLYYVYGLKGIVPAIIISSLISLLLTKYFTSKIEIVAVEQSYRETIHSGMGMVKLGVFMTLSGFTGALAAYILDAFIRKHGGIEQVGLYNAGWGIVAQYVGLIFTAMATDYYPRLSAIHTDIEKLKTTVRQQAETAIYIMTPLLALMIITMPWIVKLLYTSAFLPVVLFANLTVLGMSLRAVSWAMGYVYLAKGEGRLFFYVEIFSGLILILLNLGCYYLFKLEGLGYSFILTNIYGILLNYFLLKRKYGFTLPWSFFKIFAITYLLCIASFATTYIESTFYRYFVGIVVFVLSSLFCLYHLNRVMDLKSFFQKYADKFKNAVR